MSALDFLKWDRATFRAARTSRLVGYVRKDLVRRQVATNVRNADTISTAALLDLLRVPATTGTAPRRLDARPALHPDQGAAAHARRGAPCSWLEPGRKFALPLGLFL